MSGSYHHAEFEVLCALAHTGSLSASERRRLCGHLAVCSDCREAYQDYRSLVLTGIPPLASIYSHPDPVADWDDRPVRNALFASIRRSPRPSLEPSPGREQWAAPGGFWNCVLASHWVRVSLSASVIIAVAWGSYQAGKQRALVFRKHVSSSQTDSPKLVEAQAFRRLLDSQQTKIAVLKQESLRKEKEIESLRRSETTLEKRSQEFARTTEKSQLEVRSFAAERAALSAQLLEAEQKYSDAQKALNDLQSERDKAFLEVASLRSSVSELQASTQEQEQRLQDDERYLGADRDIRELMGARKLYIADVFDVDSRSQTRKPFGRVFYTENKSLIFYAFDLDRQPGISNATFQVWGAKDAAQGEKPRPFNLGILYMDSESNRRWVLRCDDAKQLAEIDAVFVTVEPHGGSVKPTSKPFLYALLRKVANHP
jgi:hypothetical protein